MAGRHKIVYEEGDVYDGEWSADGKRHGLGTLSLANGCRYEGEFVNGFFQGHGVLTHPGGARYEGAFEVGKYHGYGVFTAADGMKFEGKFKGGEANGLGLVTFPDGSHGRPRNEGKFEGTQCVEYCKATDATQLARQSASAARTLQQQIR